MERVVVIAEAGVNHNGCIDRAKEMVDVAVEAGADYIKFQTFKADNLVSKDAKQAPYQTKNSKVEESQYEMLKRLELTDSMHISLMDYCSQKGIRFLSTGFDIESVNYLEEKIDFYKIPSGELTNLPLVKEITKKAKPIILSTGMASLVEVKQVVEFIRNEQKAHGVKEHKLLPPLTVLHCTTAYPTEFKDVNLKAMITMKESMMVDVGYSDHTLGIEVPIAAVALGASVIEKHFTLDRGLEGPDHLASLEPAELKEMISAIRKVEDCLGTGVKEITEAEKENMAVARKSLFYANDFDEGHVLRDGDLIAKRPADGVSPMEIDSLIGKKLLCPVSKNKMLNRKDL